MEFGALWAFSNEFKVFIAVLFLIFGVYLLLFGNYNQNITLFLTGQVLTCIVFMIFMMLTFTTRADKTWVVWIYLVVGQVLGSGVGYVVRRWAKQGTVFIGVCLGGLMGSIFYSSVIKSISEKNFVLWFVL